MGHDAHSATSFPTDNLIGRLAGFKGKPLEPDISNDTDNVLAGNRQANRPIDWAGTRQSHCRSRVHWFIQTMMIATDHGDA
jgi:hypothetical protein